LYWNGSAWVVGSENINLGANAGQTNQATGGVAIGYQAARFNQATGAVALGYQAGFTGQRHFSVAIGYQAGFTGHGTGSIAIGYQAGYADAIGPNSVAIGTQAGQFGLGSNSIAIGNLAGPTGASFSNNIILNAQGVALNPNTGSAFYAAPIRNTLGSTTVNADMSNSLFYNPVSDEITYAPSITDMLPWTSYTPVWSLDGAGSTTVGNGTLTGSYKVIGKTVFFLARLVWGSSTNITSGAGLTWRLSIPITSSATTNIIANALYRDGTTYYTGSAINEPGTSTTIVTLYYVTTSGALSQVISSTPFTWANGDSLTITGTYQSV